MGDLIYRTDGELQDWLTGIGFSPQWNSGDNFILFGQKGFSRIDEEFDIQEVIVPPGDYDVRELGLYVNSSPNRPLVRTSYRAAEAYVRQRAGRP